MAKTRTLKTFTWSGYGRDSDRYFIAAATKTSATRIGGYGDPRQVHDLAEVPDPSGVAQLAAANPGRLFSVSYDGDVYAIRERECTVGSKDRPIARVAPDGSLVATGAETTSDITDTAIGGATTTEIGEQAGRDGGNDESRTAPAELPTQPAGARAPVRHVRLTAELDGRLREENRRTGALPSEIVRRALLAYLGA